MRHVGLRFFLCCGLVAPMVAAWALATPLGAAYDEPWHLARAVALVHGQIFPPPTVTAIGIESTVRVEADLLDVVGLASCLKFKPDVAASCGTDPRPAASPVSIVVSMGSYPPAYYVLVGLPTRAVPAEAVPWTARAVSACIATLLLALALYLLRYHHPNSMALLGFVVAVTPMSLFLSGVTNPSGFEVAAGLASWAALLCVTEASSPGRGLWWAAGAAAATLAIARPLGPILLAVMLIVVAASAGRSRLATLARDRGWHRPAALVGFAVLSDVLWLAAAGPSRLTGHAAPLGTTPLEAIVRILSRQGTQFSSMVGTFGWSEVRAPRLTIALWAAAFAVLAGGSLWSRSKRGAASALLLVGAIIFVQSAVDLAEFRKIGLFWSGRYSLPLAVGLPMLVAVTIRRGPRRLLVWTTLGAVAVGQVAAFLVTLHRYTAGAAAPLLSHTRWQPPGGIWLAVAVFVAAVTAYVVSIGRVAANA